MSERDKESIKDALLALYKRNGFTRDGVAVLQVWALLEIADKLDRICLDISQVTKIESHLERLVKITASK